MYVQTHGDLRIEDHEDYLNFIIYNVSNPESKITASAYDVYILLGDIKRDDGVSQGDFQLGHDIDGSVYAITHLRQPGVVILTSPQYHEIRDGRRSGATFE
jgi:hypothetical protein